MADQWESEHPNSAVVLDATALKNVVAEDTDYLLGLLSESHVAWDDDREEGVDPTLTEMTTKALEVGCKLNAMIIYTSCALLKMCNW